MQGTRQPTDLDVLRARYADEAAMTPTELVYECRGRVCVRVWVKTREQAGGSARHVFHLWTMRNGEAVSRLEFGSRREAFEAALDERAGLAAA